MEKNINDLLKLCFDCESTDCALNHKGECRFPLVHERMPVITEDDGCTEGVIDPLQGGVHHGEETSLRHLPQDQRLLQLRTEP